MEFGTIIKGAASVLQNFSKTQLAVLGLTMTMTVGGIGTGGYLIYKNSPFKFIKNFINKLCRRRSI